MKRKTQVNNQRASKTFKIINKLGLHARAAALFVKVSNRFNAEIYVSKGKNRVNGKSIMGLLMLAAAKGSRIKVETTGPEASTVLLKLEKLIVKGFNEK